MILIEIMRRTVGTVLTVVLVILAGCSGVFGGSSGEPTETLTPAAVPTDEPTPTPVPQLAPGLTRQGIVNTDALVAAHMSFLQNRSFTSRSNMTVLAPNGTVRSRSTGTLLAGPPDKGVYSVYEPERNGSGGYPNNRSYPVHTELWANEEEIFRKQTLANGTTTYEQRRSEARLGIDEAFLQYILEPFGTANTSVTEREYNGTTLYLVQGHRQSDQGFGQENRSLRLLIDDRGAIHSYRTVQQPVESGSKNIRKVNFSRIGATDAPERPSWVDRVVNRTTQISGKVSTKSVDRVKHPY